MADEDALWEASWKYLCMRAKNMAVEDRQGQGWGEVDFQKMRRSAKICGVPRR